MGLLDFMGTDLDDPKTAATLNAARGLLAAPRKQNVMQTFAEGLLGYSGAMQASKDSDLKRRFTQSQIDENASQAQQRAQMILMERQKQMAQQEFLRQFQSGQSQGAPGTAAMAAGAQQGSFGPTLDNAQRMNTMPQQPPQQGFPMSLNQVTGAKLAGLPDLLENWKAANNPTKMEGGSVYRDPVTGRERYIPKLDAGWTMGNDGRPQQLPGYAEGQARTAGLTAGATKAAEAPYTMVDSYEGGVPRRVPLSSVPGVGGNMAGGGMPQQGAPRGPNVIPANVQAERDNESVKIISAERDRAMAVGNSGLVQALTRELQRLQPSTGGQVGVQSGPSAVDATNALYDKGRTDDILKRRTSIYDAGDSAGGRIAKYQQIGTLLAKHDGNQFTPTGVEIAKLANSFGVQIDPKLGNKEAAAALTNEMALELRNPSGGAGMPGAMSDADRGYLVQMTPNLTQSAAGRGQLIQMRLALEQRNQDVAQMARNYEKKYRRLDDGFFDGLAKWSAENRLFGSQQ